MFLLFSFHPVVWSFAPLEHYTDSNAGCEHAVVNININSCSLLTTNAIFLSLSLSVTPPLAHPIAHASSTCTPSSPHSSKTSIPPPLVAQTPPSCGSWARWKPSVTWCATATSGWSSRSCWPCCCSSCWASSSTACRATLSRSCWGPERLLGGHGRGVASWIDERMGERGRRGGGGGGGHRKKKNSSPPSALAPRREADTTSPQNHEKH